MSLVRSTRAADRSEVASRRRPLAEAGSNGDGRRGMRRSSWRGGKRMALTFLGTLGYSLDHIGMPPYPKRRPLRFAITLSACQAPPRGPSGRSHPRGSQRLEPQLRERGGAWALRSPVVTDAHRLRVGVERCAQLSSPSGILRDPREAADRPRLALARRAGRARPRAGGPGDRKGEGSHRRAHWTWSGARSSGRGPGRPAVRRTVGAMSTR